VKKVRGINTLEKQEVLDIHQSLVDDFVSSGDPISPPGIKSEALLDSAVSRQIPFHGYMKNPDAFSNAATLCYGICLNHPFHNGNKRTALVSMLAHLHANGLIFEHTEQKDLYSLMLKVARHELGNDPDTEVTELSKFLRKNTRELRRGQYLVTYRELKRLLQDHGYLLENPHNNKIDVILVRTKKSLFGKEREERKKLGCIPYPGDKKVAGKGVVKKLRGLCQLTLDVGIDSEVFFNRAPRAEPFLDRYSRVLKRLSKV